MAHLRDSLRRIRENELQLGQLVDSASGTAFIATVWKLSLFTLAACCLGLSYAAFKRSRPARVTTMNIIDTGGFGASFSPEVFGYFMRGSYGIAAIAGALFL